MTKEISKQLQKKQKQILESWMTRQLANETLREDLMSNEVLREQSDELLTTLLKNMTDNNLTDTQSAAFDGVNELLAGISISRARQGFTPRETGLYIFSLKDSLQE